MKSAATIALCALLVFGYCSRTRGDHQNGSVIHPTAAAAITTTTHSSTTKQGDGAAVPALGTTTAVPKPAPAPSSTVAPALDIKANETDKHVASNASTDANSNSTGAAHSGASLPVATNQTGSLAPVPTVTDGPAVTAAGTGANETSKTESHVASEGSASQANQTHTSKEAGTLPVDNSTFTSPPSPTEAAHTTAGPQTIPTQPPKAEAPPTPSVTTNTSTHSPTTVAAPIIPQSSASPGHKKTTSKDTTTTTTTTTKGFTTTTTTPTPTTTKSSAHGTSTTTTTTISAKTTTSSPATGLDHHTQAAISQLNVGDNDNSSKGVSDPLLAGLVSVFVIAAAIVSLLVFLKFRHRNERPEFRRLQDLPMDDMMEDTPLYSY